jgi:hypothetical protein
MNLSQRNKFPRKRTKIHITTLYTAEMLSTVKIENHPVLKIWIKIMIFIG